MTEEIVMGVLVLVTVLMAIDIIRETTGLQPVEISSITIAGIAVLGVVIWSANKLGGNHEH